MLTLVSANNQTVRLMRKIVLVKVLEHLQLGKVFVNMGVLCEIERSIMKFQDRMRNSVICKIILANVDA